MYVLCMFVRTCLCMCVCTYVFVYVCMYVYIYVCVYVCNVYLIIYWYVHNLRLRQNLRYLKIYLDSNGRMEEHEATSQFRFVFICFL
jgi:hypothetical protein